MAQYTTATSSGDYRVDALLNGDVARWNASGPEGSPATVTYSFMTTAPDAYNGRVQDFQPFNDVMKAHVREVFANISSNARVDFVEVASGGQMEFGTLTAITNFGSAADQGLGWAPNSGFDAWQGDVWINNTASMGLTNPTGVENHGSFVLTHEILHALGLKHADQHGSGDVPPYLTGAEDSTNYTVMSNYGGPNWSLPQAYDTLAMKYVYGSRTATTIGRETVGDDTANTLTGDGQNNILQGYAGDDTLDGGTGNDDIAGGTGNDLVAGGLGNDALYGNQDADTLSGGDGADALYGGQGADSLDGGAGNDLLYGNMADDTMSGGDGDDTFFGGQGNDLMVGGAGNDWLLGNLGDDTLTGGAGADVFVYRAGQGADTITDFSAAEGDRVNLGGAAHTMTGSASGEAVIVLGSGGTLTLKGVTAAQVSEGWFVTA